jgi:hypothetical protein
MAARSVEQRQIKAAQKNLPKVSSAQEYANKTSQ